MSKRFVEHRVRRPGSDNSGPVEPKTPVGGTVPPGDAALVRTSVARPGGLREIGGPEGPEPTRFGDWERKGICVDF